MTESAEQFRKERRNPEGAKKRREASESNTWQNRPHASLICLLVNEGENGDGAGIEGPFGNGGNNHV